MKTINELLRSAHAIASREGKDTNWEAFKSNVEKGLLTQAGVSGTTDEQTILRATCTPLTYRMPESKAEQGWLIELNCPVAMLSGQWLQPDFSFQPDAANAIRFSRKADADALIAWGLKGVECTANEHGWIWGA